MPKRNKEKKTILEKAVNWVAISNIIAVGSTIVLNELQVNTAIASLFPNGLSISALRGFINSANFMISIFPVALSLGFLANSEAVDKYLSPKEKLTIILFWVLFSISALLEYYSYKNGDVSFR